MNKYLFIGLWCALYSTYALALDVTNYWTKGTLFYQQQKYDSALNQFQCLANQKVANPELYYNIGNCYYNLNRPEFAILNYEKALQRKTNYEAAKTNLEIVRNGMGIGFKDDQELFIIRWWKLLTCSQNSNKWAVATLFSLLLLGILYYFKSNIKGVSKIFFLIALFSCIFLALSFLSYWHLKPINQAIILSNNCTFYKDEKGNINIGKVPQGLKIEINKVQQNFSEVSLPNAKTGWIKKENYQIID